MTTSRPPVTAGRQAQRRRTRRAIVAATMQLIANGGEPSVNDIAEAAEVSRRTVYLHFPTLDQLLLDATVGLMNVDVDAVLAKVDSDDPHERLTRLIAEVYRNMQASVPLGRKLIKLTVDAAPPAAGEPRRGYRRIAWIEWALEPLRGRLGARDFARLVSTLAVVIGWESYLTLSDVRGLGPKQAQSITQHAARVLLDAALADAAS